MEPEPKVYVKKEFVAKKRGRKLILQAESESTDTEEEPKKVKATGKATKPVKEVPKATVPINVLNYNLETNFERTEKTLGRNRFDNVKDHFDSFNEDEKEQIIQQVINYLCHYNRLPHDLEKDISNSLYTILLNKWEEAVKKEKEIIDDVFVQYFSDLSNDELNEFLDKYKFQFAFKARRLKLLSGKVQHVETETHQIAHNIQWMQELIHSSKDEQDTIDVPEMDEEEIVQDDVVYPVKKKDDTISQ